ncbi:MAG: hypothetical protein V3T86_00705 [Planctomycetota bacterium]
MRSLIVLIVAVAAFAYVLVRPHTIAEAMLQSERDAVERLMALHATPGRESREEAGYRFRWSVDGPMPEILVAEPLIPGQSGARSFAVGPDKRVYVRDPVTSAALPPPMIEAALRRHLGLSAKERAQKPGPRAWRLLDGQAQQADGGADSESSNHPANGGSTPPPK